jgi:ubiquinone/menaquinone biosynthesis C-methylase UbiE
MVRESAALARREGLSNLRLVQADAHHLPFGDGAFPAILCTNGLQVMPGLDATARELARVLAPGGTLFVSVVGVPLRGRSLPTFFATRNVRDALEGAGLGVRTTHRVQMATMYEAER